jgi:hypothetical protein
MTIENPSPTQQQPKPEPNKRSNLDSYRDQLTGQIHVSTPEDTAAFKKHCAEILETLVPVGPIERQLAQAMAEDMWRLQRARALENGIFALGHRRHVDEMKAGHPQVDTALAQSQTFIDQARTLHLLTVYELRIHRAYEKNTAQLKALQAERKSAHKHAEEQAIMFAQLAAAKGEAYQPANDFLPASDFGGFAYSKPALAQVRERESRLRQAQEYKFGYGKYRPKPTKPENEDHDAA